MSRTIQGTRKVLASLDEARCHDALSIQGRSAEVCVYELGKVLSFEVTRVFTVHAREQVERGGHAHRECQMAMACLAGICEVRLDDGATSRTVRLDHPTRVLCVPPSIWAEQHYRTPDTILMVLCERLYDEADYIRDYDRFRAYRGQAG